MANTRISSETGIDKVKPGTVVQASLAAPFYLPSPQTWQDVKASRVLGTPYQNLTGQPIKISIIFNAGASGNSAITVGDKVVAYSTTLSNTIGWLYADVPDGAICTVTSNVATVNTWTELR